MNLDYLWNNDGWMEESQHQQMIMEYCSKDVELTVGLERMMKVIEYQRRAYLVLSWEGRK